MLGGVKVHAPAHSNSPTPPKVYFRPSRVCACAAGTAALPASLWADAATSDSYLPGSGGQGSGWRSWVGVGWGGEVETRRRRTTGDHRRRVTAVVWSTARRLPGHENPCRPPSKPRKAARQGAPPRKYVSTVGCIPKVPTLLSPPCQARPRGRAAGRTSARRP